jgi:hypothetical protein
MDRLWLSLWAGGRAALCMHSASFRYSLILHAEASRLGMDAKALVLPLSIRSLLT